jgi:hypothetical protein
MPSPRALWHIAAMFGSNKEIVVVVAIVALAASLVTFGGIYFSHHRPHQAHRQSQ